MKNNNNDSNLGKRGAGDNDGDQDPSRIQRVNGDMVTPTDKTFGLGTAKGGADAPGRTSDPARPRDLSRIEANPKGKAASAFKKQYEELTKGSLVGRSIGELNTSEFVRALGGGVQGGTLTPIQGGETVTDNRPVTPNQIQGDRTVNPPIHESPGRTIVRNLELLAERRSATPLPLDSKVNENTR